MKARDILIVVGCGTGAGFAAATAATFFDWRLNPGGLFHDGDGTDWQIVWDTALSWFLPLAAVSTLLAAAVLLSYRTIRERRSRREQ